MGRDTGHDSSFRVDEYRTRTTAEVKMFPLSFFLIVLRVIRRRALLRKSAPAAVCTRTSIPRGVVNKPHNVKRIADAVVKEVQWLCLHDSSTPCIQVDLRRRLNSGDQRELLDMLPPILNNGSWRGITPEPTQTFDEDKRTKVIVRIKDE